jgi:molybdopterin converting factor small subunit
MVTVSKESHKVKLIGVLGSAANNREVQVETSPQATVSDLIASLLRQVTNPQFKDFLVDSATHDPRPNVIILLDEQDCNLFHGLKTRLEPDMKVTIIPVAHGG